LVTAVIRLSLIRVWQTRTTGVCKETGESRV
jgi:hypothetical protein